MDIEIIKNILQRDRLIILLFRTMLITGSVFSIGIAHYVFNITGIYLLNATYFFFILSIAFIGFLFYRLLCSKNMPIHRSVDFLMLSAIASFHPGMILLFGYIAIELVNTFPWWLVEMFAGIVNVAIIALTFAGIVLLGYLRHPIAKKEVVLLKNLFDYLIQREGFCDIFDKIAPNGYVIAFSPKSGHIFTSKLYLDISLLGNKSEEDIDKNSNAYQIYLRKAVYINTILTRIVRSCSNLEIVQGNILNDDLNKSIKAQLHDRDVVFTNIQTLDMEEIIDLVESYIDPGFFAMAIQRNTEEDNTL